MPTAALHMKNGRRLLATGDEQGALMEFIRASEIDPSDQAAQQEIAKVRALHKEQPPTNTSGVPESAGEETRSRYHWRACTAEASLTNEPLTLHMVEDSKVVYQAVGKAAGVNVLFDPDYTGKRIQVDLTNVSLLDALRIVGTISSTFWRPITSQHHLCCGKHAFKADASSTSRPCKRSICRMPGSKTISRIRCRPSGRFCPTLTSTVSPARTRS